MDRVHCLEQLLLARSTVLVAGPPSCGKTATWQLLHAALNQAAAASRSTDTIPTDVAVHHVRSCCVLKLLAACWSVYSLARTPVEASCCT